MCSISKNATVDEQLSELERSSDREMIERRLFNFAQEANIEDPGALDNNSCHMKRMSADLRQVRKKRIGRHRIFFTGHHTNCTYRVVYIKAFKKNGVDAEDDKRFQNKLIRILGESENRIISLPSEIS